MEKQIQKSEITSIGAYDDRNYMNFSDTDSSVDYFHGYSASLKNTIEEVKKRGADYIRVYGSGGGDTTYIQRAKRIAKAAGYSVQYNNNDEILLVKNA